MTATTELPDDARGVLVFWFEEIGPDQWFGGGAALDAWIRARFATLHARLSRQVPASWQASAQGMLAAIIVLDQFSRHLFRNDPRAFATDARALALAKRALAKGYDTTLSPAERSFFYMPFQHSESRADQARSVALFRALGDPDALRYALEHKAVIDRFGRFPHRNRILGRPSTPEERAFLKEPGSSW